MNTYRNIWGIITLLMIILMELAFDRLWLDRFVEGKYVGFNETLPRVLIVFFIIFSCSVIFNWKFIFPKNNSTRKNRRRTTDILKTLIKNTVSGDPLDLIFVLFFLCHLTWIPDSIFECVKNDPMFTCDWARLARPGIYILGLLGAVWFKPHSPKHDSHDSKVLLSAISSINEYTYDSFILPILKKKLEKVFVFYSNDMECKKDEATLKRLKDYGVSDQTINEIITTESFNKNILEHILKDSLKNYGIKDIQLVACDFNDLKKLLSEVQDTVSELLGNSDYQDENLLFNLTPGTKNISIALGIHSVKGKRMACYLKQDNTLPLEEKYVEVTLDVFELKDIFSELTD